MSWQAYIDTSLVSTGHIDKAAIISIAGDSVWAASTGFTVKADEMKNLVAILGGTAKDVEKAQAEGVHVDGERYVVTKIEDRSIYARKGKNGIVVVKTTQAILVGHYGENVQAGNAAQTVEQLADYLIGTGY